MDQTQTSIAFLGVVMGVISVWWINITLKEGRKAVEERKNER